MKNEDVAEDVDWEKLVEITEGYSGADLANVCRDAAMMPLRRMLIAGKLNVQEIEARKDELKVPLTMKDMLEALKNISKSVNKSQLDDYQKWMDEFGSV